GEVTVAQPLPALPDPAVEHKVSAATDAVSSFISKAREELESAERAVAAARTATRGHHDELQKELKASTEALEKLQQGAGEHGRRVSALRQQLAERDGYVARVRELSDEMARLRDDRGAALDELERLGDD